MGIILAALLSVSLRTSEKLAMKKSYEFMKQGTDTELYDFSKKNIKIGNYRDFIDWPCLSC